MVIASVATGGTVITITEVDTLADTKTGTTMTGTDGRRVTRLAARTRIRMATPRDTTAVVEERCSAYLSGFLEDSRIAEVELMYG